MPKKKIGHDLTNWYEKSTNFNVKYHNPNAENCCNLIKHVSKGVILGNSGAGKSQTLLEIIYRCQDTWAYIVLACQDKSEPLYEYLKSKIKERLIFYEGYSNLPSLDEIAEKYTNDGKNQVLFVADDMILESKQEKISSFFVRGRKKNISSIYLGQHYTSIPLVIRQQMDWLIIRKIPGVRTLKFVLNDFNLGVDQDTLIKMYKYATNNPRDFLFIDVSAYNDRFRRNFHEILNVTNHPDDNET